MRVQFSLMRRVVEPWGTPTFVFEHALRRAASDHARVMAAREAGDAERVGADYRDPFSPGMDQDALDDHRAWLREELGLEPLDETRELVAS